MVSDLTGKELTRDEATGIAEESSFERQPGRRSGEEGKGSFLRKGVVGDWRNQFSPQARKCSTATPAKG